VQNVNKSAVAQVIA